MMVTTMMMTMMMDDDDDDDDDDDAGRDDDHLLPLLSIHGFVHPLADGGLEEGQADVRHHQSTFQDTSLHWKHVRC